MKMHLDELKEVRLFYGLSPAQIELVFPLLKSVSFPKGSYIIRDQTTGDELYILKSGTVKVTKRLVKDIDSPETGEKQIATLTSDYKPSFGENGVLGRNMRSANVIAHTDCELYTLSRSDYDAFAVKHPEIALQIMRNIASILSERLIYTDENLVKLATALFISVSR